MFGCLQLSLVMKAYKMNISFLQNIMGKALPSIQQFDSWQDPIQHF